MPKRSLQIQELLAKDKLDASEILLLRALAETAASHQHQQIMQRLYEIEIVQTEPLSKAAGNRILLGIHEKMMQRKRSRRRKMVWIGASVSAAASLLLIAGIWFKQDNKPGSALVVNDQVAAIITHDVEPGGNKALLTLDDGSSIILDSAGNGLISDQGAVKVIKLDGTLSYQGKKSDQQIQYNTISTPRGGQYQIVLPDGSHVWLNAASSIRFPTSFVSNERRVEITGEVYFEISKNKNKPFIVKANQSEVEVLGTHFNVMAYADEEAMNTTLLEGSVKFITAGNTTLLKPGQQSSLKSGQVTVVPNADIENVMAWKNGLFHFDDVEFGQMARQLSRWYDVEVICPRKVNELFNADIPRDTKLSDVLKALELTGKINFEIQGKKIIVTP